MSRHPHWREPSTITDSRVYREPSLGDRRPNLFIIGSMKSGTTYLHNLLASHPSIFMCFPKEPSAFVEPDQLRTLWPWIWEQGYWRDRERYLQLFESAGAAKILGTGSVYYTHLPLATGVPERIHRFNPDSRLIYVMRDPTERAISHYWHQVRWHGEHRSVSSAIKNDSRYRDVSHYAMQLAPYFEIFPRDQIKTLTFEELINKTEHTLTEIFRWLNVEHSTAWETVPPENATPETIKQRKGFGLLSRLRIKNRLLRVTIDSAPESIRRFALRLVSRKVTPSRVDASDTADYLRPLQQRQTVELTKLLGREFPEWKTLYAR
jgi:Sulfotransferase family